MLWIELTTPDEETLWVNFATFQTMLRDERGHATHLLSVALNAEGRADVTTVKETPEEILKLAGVCKKPGASPTGVGFIHSK